MFAKKSHARGSSHPHTTTSRTGMCAFIRYHVRRLHCVVHRPLYSRAHPLAESSVRIPSIEPFCMHVTPIGCLSNADSHARACCRAAHGRSDQVSLWFLNPLLVNVNCPAAIPRGATSSRYRRVSSSCPLLCGSLKSVRGSSLMISCGRLPRWTRRRVAACRPLRGYGHCRTPS